MKKSWGDLFSSSGEIMKPSAIREILKITQRNDIISFAGGLPAPELFPIERFSQASVDVLHKQGASALQYSLTEGELHLREFIAKRMVESGINATIRNILITGGSQQGIDLVGRIFINPHDSVGIESPSYLGAIQSLKSYQPKFIVLPMDRDGMLIDDLEKKLSSQHIKAIYLIPNFQNPSGISLSPKRREQLAYLAYQNNIIVIEDDPYSELFYENNRNLSVMATGQKLGLDINSIYLGTFSKILAPGIRLGWVVSHESVIAKLTEAKQANDLHESTFLQMMTCEIVKDGFLDQHVELIRNTYRTRRDIMLECIEAEFPPTVKWTIPKGGLFIWAELPSEIDTSKILVDAVEQYKVAFVPGYDFHPDQRGKNTFRLNFSNAKPEEIHEGIHRLGSLLFQVIS